MEIFNTKINNFANLECSTKILGLENLELYCNIFWIHHVSPSIHVQNANATINSSTWHHV